MNRFVFAAVAAALIASPALADDGRMPVKMHVNLKGVDVNTQAGAELAFKRIGVAARRTCTMDNPGRRTSTIDEICLQEMTTKAVAALNSPQLLALLKSQQDASNG